MANEPQGVPELQAARDALGVAVGHMMKAGAHFEGEGNLDLAEVCYDQAVAASIISDGHHSPKCIEPLKAQVRALRRLNRMQEVPEIEAWVLKLERAQAIRN